MRIRIKVYDTDGQFHNRLDISLVEPEDSKEVADDIEGFLLAQLIELEEGGL